jgi:L,D-transpeptidase ErfK/SrfK
MLTIIFRKPLVLTSCLVFLTLHAPSSAGGRPLPSIVGTQAHATVAAGESLMEVAVRTGFGYEALAAANPQLDPWTPVPGREIILPGRVILPRGAAEGLTINLAEMRLFHISDHAGQIRVRVYPLGIGREGRETPEGRFAVIAKQAEPTWHVPQGLRALHPELPELVPPGPANPLGHYWLGLSVKGYGIHGTNRPLGVGRRVSYGCMRLYPVHIAELFAAVEPGTPVKIVYQPVKLAWQGDDVLMEAHADYLGRFDDLFQETLRNISRFGGAVEIDYRRVKEAVEHPDGLLHPIGKRAE